MLDEIKLDNNDKKLINQNEKMQFRLINPSITNS